MGTAYDLATGADTYWYPDKDANRRMNESYREREQRKFDAMSPKQQQEERDRRNAAMYVDGPMARRDDKWNFMRYNDKKAKGNWDGMTPEELDVSDKAFRQLANENKRIENMSRAMKESQSGKKKGGKITAKKMASGGKVSSASKRADGCAIRGKTKGRIV